MLVRYRALGFTPSELTFMQSVFQDPRAWQEARFEQHASSAHTEVDCEIRKVAGRFIDTTFPPYLHGLSVADLRTHPARVYLRAESWNTPPVTSGYGRDTRGYRTYLLLHEMGHVLGYGHATCPAPGLPAPVMMQQSKGTGACYPHPWVEKRRE